MPAYDNDASSLQSLNANNFASGRLREIYGGSPMAARLNATAAAASTTAETDVLNVNIPGLQWADTETIIFSFINQTVALNPTTFNLNVWYGSNSATVLSTTIASASGSTTGTVFTQIYFIRSGSTLYATPYDSNTFNNTLNQFSSSGTSIANVSFDATQVLKLTCKMSATGGYYGVVSGRYYKM